MVIKLRNEILLNYLVHTVGIRKTMTPQNLSQKNVKEDIARETLFWREESQC
jgi:hypothetical protein